MKKLIFILTLYMLVPTILLPQEYVNSSVLSSGSWHKIKIVNEGIYRIDYEDLSALGLNPGNEVALYSNNFGLLSYYNDDPSPDDLRKIAVFVERGPDGLFNEGDYILFYGNSTHRWKYDYDQNDYYFQRHYYSDTAIYFMRFNESPIEIYQQPDPGQTSNVSAYSDYLFIHEIEKQNIMKSGREWFDPLAAGADYYIDTDVSTYNIESGSNMTYSIRVLGRSSDPAVIRLNNGSEMVSSIMLPEVNINNTAGTYASSVEETGEIDISEGNPDIYITFHNNGNLTARAWIDYLTLQARVENEYHNPDKHYIIRDKSSIQQGSITEFKLRSSHDDLLIWDISNENKIRSIPGNYSSGEYSFKSVTDSMKTFIAFRIQDALIPIIDTDPVENQNLHEPGQYDMIVLTHPSFHDYATELANMHYVNDQYQSLIVTPFEIYNEFSGGIPDISAIRNFVRMVYSRNKGSDRPLKYLLLFGDGSYENKTLPPDNPNYIPTYQTLNSNVKVLSFTSDDYYGLLDPGEGEYEGSLDIGIGRLPVSDTVQAGAIIKKIREYMSNENLGPWKNIVTMVADDEDNNIHMYDSDRLAQLIESIEPSFNIEKIYLDSYKQVTSISGQSYPEATRAINDRINSGCLIMNYAGHGNELGLAHERVVNTENINSWTNKGKYPAFVTATCEFSRFEDIHIDEGTGEISQESSAGELALLHPDGGAIALFSTTRIVFASHNYTLASNLYENAFTRDENGKGLTMGEIMRLAKINTEGANKRNFTLLGDPALRLAWPWHGSVITDSVNGRNVTVFSDTIMGLTELTITGHINDRSGNPVESFNGFLYPTLFDKEYEITTLANDGGKPFDYMMRDRILFKGQAEVVNGKFSVSMLIPRDIDYRYGKGKISYFAAANDSDHNGFYDDIIIGGLNNPAVIDTIGPVISLFLNDTLFRNGGITDTNPVLLAHLSDPGSINTTGTGIGHDIVATIDSDNNIILNSFYENDIGTYKSGKIIYPLTTLEKGEHVISLKAWDNFNNSSTVSLLFFVRDEEGLVLNKLINYPNPFTNSTKISLEHNRPDDNIEITINIFSSAGMLVKTIKTTQSTGGYRIDPVIWDGKDNKGGRVAPGIYIYTVDFKTENNETVRTSGRMIIL